MPDDDDSLERVEVADLLINRRLDRGGLALAAGAVDRDQGLRLGELHPLPYGHR